MAWPFHAISLVAREVFTLSDTNAEFYEVVTCDEFSDGVFHLNTRIDFEEVEISIGVSKEFEGC